MVFGLRRRTVLAVGIAALAVALVTVLLTAPEARSSVRSLLPSASPASAPAARTAAPLALPVKPNIMVVMLDDMRSDELRFAPNARRYVRDRGVDFRNSFSPYPLCCPARASFLLGKYAHNHHVLYHEAPYGFGSLDDHLTIAGRLQDAGYQTAMVGKYLNKYGDQPSKVTGRSSEHYVPAGWTDWMAGLETRWRPGSGLSGNTYDYFNFTQNINGRTVQHRGQYSSTVIGDEVRGLITKYHRNGAPFFLWVTPVAPHHGAPYESDDPGSYRESNGRLQKFVTPARPAWVKGRFDKVITHAPGQPVHGPAEADMRDKPRFMRHAVETTPYEKRALRTAERQRAESIFAWDKEFGKIVARLKATGEYDSTVIVFTSDNGFYIGEHRLRLGKIKPYEPVIHVPLLVAGPGISPGVRYSPVITPDLTPTILQLAGAADLPATDSASKVATIFGPDQDWTVPVVTEGLLKEVRRVKGSGVPAGLTTSGLRTGRYKLIMYADREAQLYDLQTDPNELSSVWRRPAYRKIRTELVALWARYRACKEAACQVPLPDDLVTTPQWLATQSAHAERAKVAYYDR
ncbi:MAG: sulfatase-like hydrolase/transferase [Marmoricola sp.]